MSESPLKDLHAVVTGAGRGIGAAIAQELASQGAHLTLMSRTEKELKKVQTELNRKDDQKITTCVVDLSVPSSIEAAFEQCSREISPPQILVNNAGSVTTSPSHKISLEDWDFSQHVNLRGPFLCMQQVLPAMIAKRFGRIINIASTAGLKGYRYTSHYCAAKHGVVGLTRSIALEVAPSGVTVNAVCPGFTDTPMLQSSLKNVSDRTGQSTEALKEEFLKDVPLGRFIKPQEIASSVAWLCQRSQAAITGQTIVISGGEV